jgi:hypothetical protein
MWKFKVQSPILDATNYWLFVANVWLKHDSARDASHYWFWIKSLWIGDTANWITDLRRIQLSCTRDPNFPLYPSHFVITAIQLLRAPTTSRWLRHTRIPSNSVTLEFRVTWKPSICGWLQWPGTTGDSENHEFRMTQAPSRSALLWTREFRVTTAHEVPGYFGTP